MALALFNVGVEVGQLLSVAAVFCAFWLLRLARQGSAASSRASAWQVADALSMSAAYLIGTLGALWLFERVALFWS